MPFLLTLFAILLLVYSVRLRLRKVLAAQTLLVAWGLGAAGCVSVESVASATWIVGGVDGLLLLSIGLSPRSLLMEQFGAGLRRRRVARGVLLSTTIVVVMLGATEWAFCLLDLAGIASPQAPVKVLMTPKVEDWRLATILYDKRLIDPVLFWRPAPDPPYNEQGFKGPVMAVPKPPGTVRVMCYGDSNTDGPPTDSWATLLGPELQKLVDNRRVEAVNAGVSGYSSYQGMRKFEMEVKTYLPDVALVSFGWNDAADALGQADKGYLPPSPVIADLQRVLYRARSFRMLMQWVRRCTSQVKASGPRVSVEDYAANLRTIAAIGRQHGVKVVLLTRPYKDPVARAKGWRSTLPLYNAALRELAAREGVPLIDVQKLAEGHLDVFIDECHFSMPGHKVAAHVLAEELAPLL